MRYKFLSRAIMWLGGGVLPQSAYVESYLQQSTGYLIVRHLTEPNKLLRHITALPATLVYKKVEDKSGMSMHTLADASYKIAAGFEYGQI